jgi:hypothetical protein
MKMPRWLLVRFLQNRGTEEKVQFVMEQAASTLFRDCKGALHTDDNRI